MTYQEAKDKKFAEGRIKDGWDGLTSPCYFTFSDNNILVVTQWGYFKSVLPPVEDEIEGAWLLKHHPEAKKLYSNITLL